MTDGEGNTRGGDRRESPIDPTESKTLSMRGHSMHENREVPRTPDGEGPPGRPEKGLNWTSGTHVRGKSDRPVVPMKSPNKGGSGVGGPSAEGAEGRGLTKGNMRQTATPRTQSRAGVSNGLRRVREVARRDRRARFTALLHHVTVDRLRESFYALKREAVPGVDGVTWAQYEVGLEDRLQDLHDGVHRGTYRALPSKRAYIPKADGRMRPLGIAALEDKVVQHAVGAVLTPIYEEDFLGFSYGFRPGRSQHRALDALWVGITGKKVNWVLDADIRGFYDTLDHGWLTKFLEHRIADRRILRLVRKWLRAGVSEDGEWSETKVGVPQGAVISPLLGNVYLHYVFDTWVEWWRHQCAQGDVIVVRYADDVVMGFQYRQEAERFLREYQERLKKFGLALHPDKTRLIEFGRFAAETRRKRGQGKPETFDFLGLTHMCGTKRGGGFALKRKTMAKRLRTKLQKVKETLMRHRHKPVAEQGGWLRGVVQGYFNYHAIPGNRNVLDVFRVQVLQHWLRALRRRSQKSRMNWKRFGKLVERWIPRPRTLHPYPSGRFYALHPR